MGLRGGLATHAVFDLGSAEASAHWMSAVHSGGLIINIILYNDRRDFKQLHPQHEELAKLLISRL